MYYTFKFLRTFYWYPAVVKKNSAATRCINHIIPVSIYLDTDLYTSPFSIYLHRFDLKWNSIIFTFKSTLSKVLCILHIFCILCLYFSDHHQTVQLIKDKRSNSCFSESSEPGSLKNGAEQGRRPSRYVFRKAKYQKSLSNMWQYFSCLLDEGISKIWKKLNSHDGFLS